MGVSPGWAIGGALVALTVTITVASAHSPSEGSTDRFNVPGGTRVHGKAIGSITFEYGFGIGTGTNTATCKFARFTGTVRHDSLKMAITPITFSDAAHPCQDVNQGQTGCGLCTQYGTDTFTANSANGPWLLEERDNGNDEGQLEPNSSGDRVTITVPKAGLIDAYHVRGHPTYPPCILTFAPDRAANITGTYDDAGTITLGTSIPYFSPCNDWGNKTGIVNAGLSITFRLHPAIYDVG